MGDIFKTVTVKVFGDYMQSEVITLEKLASWINENGHAINIWDIVRSINEPRDDTPYVEYTVYYKDQRGD